MVEKMKTMSKYIIAASAAVLALALVSCEKMSSIGGTVNSTEKLDITTSEWLASQPETAVVAQLFEKAGLNDVINGEVTLLAPNQWAVNRYIRRHNSMTRKADGDEPFILDSLMNEDLSRLLMYVYPGVFTIEDIPEEGVYLTSLDGSQEVFLRYEENNTDPTAAYDGGNVAGAGYQYSNFLMTTPKVLHAVFKKGEAWEDSYLQRRGLGFDNPECDQAYKMYFSNVKTKNGVVHVLYVGDSEYAEQYYYHSLFFYGTRQDDKQ